MMTNKITDYELKELKAQSGIKAAEILYNKAVRGEEIDRQICDMFRAKFQVTVKYDSHRNAWWVVRSDKEHYGECVYNPATERGGFPDLVTLLKWCIKNRS